MKSIKSHLFSLAIGVVILLALLGIILMITNNVQLIIPLGYTLLFLASTYYRKRFGTSWFAPLLIAFPFGLAYVLLVLPQLPSLWWAVPGFVLFAYLGYWKADKPWHQRLVEIVSVVGFGLLLLYQAPDGIAKDLSQPFSQPLPDFELTSLKGEVLSKNQLKGTVLVIDFFGTWCKPCIKELEVIQEVQGQFSDQSDVLFMVVNANLGGDTPEKFQEFVASHSYKFDYAYDHNSRFYKSLELPYKGLPLLMVVDKNSTIRMLHMGYNPAETGFADHLTDTINALR